MAARRFQGFGLLLLFFFSLAALSSAQPLKTLRIPLPEPAVGPETTAFDCKGNGPYVGVADGRILKWDHTTLSWTDFATVVPHGMESCNSPNRNDAVCGRPLGLKFHPNTCELYIADAYFGLMKVGPDGGVAQSVVSHVDGVPMKFTNDLDIDPDTGVVYFTDSSMVYQRSQRELIISTGDRTGRLLKYDPRDGSVEVLLGGLAFANGVALSSDRSFLLVAETTPGHIQKFLLSTGHHELFAQLSGRPDNINLNADGSFWIAQNPTLLPASIARRTRDRGSPVKMDSSRRILRILDNAGSTSDVKEMNNIGWKELNNRVWAGSVANSRVTVWL